MADIKLIYDGILQNAGVVAITFGAEDYLIALFAEAEAIMIDPNEVDIVNKLVLSIAIRYKAEEYMERQLTAAQMAVMKPNRNRTAELLNVFKAHHSVDLEDQCLLMNKVLMLTSENIHFNNFMFEPLVDISILHLKQLYTDVKALLP